MQKYKCIAAIKYGKIIGRKIIDKMVFLSYYDYTKVVVFDINAITVGFGVPLPKALKCGTI